MSMKNFKFIHLAIFLLVVLFLPYVAFGDDRSIPLAQGIHEAETEIKNPELKNEKKSISQNASVVAKSISESDAEIRRSRVSNAVQEMFMVAERNKGIGQQIRVIAQNQKKNQEALEKDMEKAESRGKLKRFFFGADYKTLNSAENKLKIHTEELDQLKQLALEIQNIADTNSLEEQIKVMEQIKNELEQEINSNKKGFSLFGWLGRIFTK